jgi:multiple sugar transport system ATP-binding protein
MSQGVLQQVDTPQRLYDQPANLFVAGFIGTPPMNLIETEVVAENGEVALALANDRLPLSNQALARYPGVRRSGGRRVVLGVRADDLHPAGDRPDLPTLDGRLELVEALGSQSIAYFRVEAHAIRSGAEGLEDAVEEEGEAQGVTAARPNLVASFPARAALGLRLEEQMPVAVDVAHVHLFDAETGEPLR